MAIIKSNSIGKAKGSIGNITYAYVGGDTVGKSKVAFPKNPQTLRQMLRRVKWANLVNLYQAIGNPRGLHPAYEAAVGRVSDYNVFIARNIGRSLVNLTKSQAAMGGCCAQPGLVISEGSLSKIQHSLSNGVVATDIDLTGLVLDENTTIAAFSAAVVSNNPDYAYGDQITVFVFRQTTEVNTGIPRVNVTSEQVTLLNDSETLLADIIDPINFSVVDGKLGMAEAVNGGVAYVHSRIVDGMTQVSTQEITGANSAIAPFVTDAAQELAIVSYGGNLTQRWLTPHITDEELVTP